MGLDDLIAYTPGKAEVPRAIHLVATGQIGRLAALIPPTTENRADLAYMALIQCSEPWASWRHAEVEPPHERYVCTAALPHENASSTWPLRRSRRASSG